MSGTKVEIKSPLCGKLKQLADLEELPLDQLVDYILRRYLEDWEHDNLVDDEDEDEDEDSDDEDA